MRTLCGCVLVLCFMAQAEAPGISVAARLTGFEEFHWFENHGESTSDGVAPLASFIVLEPEEFAGESVRILLKHAVLDVALETLPAGGVYRFTVPGDFFGSGAEILEDMDISGYSFLSGGDE